MDNLKKAMEVLRVLASLEMTAVPIEPSPDMISAGVKAGNGVDEETVKKIYAAMLLASDESMML